MRSNGSPGNTDFDSTEHPVRKPKTGLRLLARIIARYHADRYKQDKTYAKPENNSRGGKNG